MRKMINIILLILGIVIATSAYSLWANKLPWKEPPGVLTRLSVYLSQNVAETSDDAIFPELKPRTYPIAAKPFLDELTSHIIALGWKLQSVDPDQMIITAAVQTKWLKFTDDITIRLEPVSAKETRLHIRSVSRVGTADFGANLGHILRLYWNLG
jgi:uncharacterized protein (DUF1499 family)